jgi:hypothetical protein
MGYRSDVAVGVGLPSKEHATAFLTSVRLRNALSWEDLQHYQITVASDQMVVLHAYFESVKWYDSYPDVKCHHELLGMAGEQGYGTAFIRIGEEYNDIAVELDGGTDHEFDMWDFFGVHRAVVSPRDGTTIREFINANEE